MLKPIRTRPLDGKVTASLSAQAIEAGLTLAIAPPQTVLNLRLSQSDTPALARLGEALGASLPLVANTWLDAPAARLHWLGPDEWLITSSEEDLYARMTAALDGSFAALVDCSHQFQSLRLSGKSARALLAKLVAMDIDSRVFTTGQCAGTLLAMRVTVTLVCEDERPSFRLFTRRSFIADAWDWIMDAGLEYGIVGGQIDAQ